MDMGKGRNGAPQVCQKLVPMEILFAESDLADLWAEDKLTRTAAWNCLRTVVRKLELLVVGDASGKMTLPPSLAVEACGPTQRRLRGADGWWIQDDAVHLPRRWRVVPPHRDPKR